MKFPFSSISFLSKIDDEHYISTSRGGFKFDQTSHTIGEEEVLSRAEGKNWVYQVVQDKQNNVYVYSENLVGLFKQISPGNHVYVPSSLFQLRQSFNNDLLRVSRKVQEGILFNANDGFIHYIQDLEDRVSIASEPLVSRIFSVAEDSVLYSRMPFHVRPEMNLFRSPRARGFCNL